MFKFLNVSELYKLNTGKKAITLNVIHSSALYCIFNKYTTNAYYLHVILHRSKKKYCFQYIALRIYNTGPKIVFEYSRSCYNFKYNIIKLGLHSWLL